ECGTLAKRGWKRRREPAGRQAAPESGFHPEWNELELQQPASNPQDNGCRSRRELEETPMPWNNSSMKAGAGGIANVDVRHTVRSMIVWITPLAALGALAWHGAPAANAQITGGARFEVASIRLSKDPAPGGDISITPGRFRGKDLALQWLILTAWRINSKFLSGNLPDWTVASHDEGRTHVLPDCSEGRRQDAGGK